MRLRAQIAICLLALALAETSAYAKKPELKHSACASKIYELLTAAADWKNPARTVWALDPALDERMKAVFLKSGLSNQERVGELFRELMEARVASSSPATKWLMENAIDDALKQHSIYSRTVGRILERYAGPHYNPIVNRAVVPTDPDLGARRYMVAVHELEHAFHRNSNLLEMAAMSAVYPKELFMIFRTPLTPILRSRVEMRAIGAQWELANRIPAEFRRKLGLRPEN